MTTATAASPDCTVVLDDLERRIVNAYQRGLPTSPRPYAVIANRLGVSEAEVLAALKRLRASGVLDRVGAVVAPHRAGWSTLAAMAVPAERFEETAQLVSGYAQVNHNYERENALNLWFVVAGADENVVRGVLADIERRTGLAVIDLPLVEAYHIDLGFALP
jgi:DNA-binding Lrp family transcriptional regulator